jgi:clan AA aspartic protease
VGTFLKAVAIGNPEGTRFENVEALVDTGATYSVFPASLLRKLKVPLNREAIFVLGDGREVRRGVGQTWLEVDGNRVITLVIFGDEGITPLLGSYALEGLLLEVDPYNKKLVPVKGYMVSWRTQVSRENE